MKNHLSLNHVFTNMQSNKGFCSGVNRNNVGFSGNAGARQRRLGIKYLQQADQLVIGGHHLIAIWGQAIGLIAF